MWPWLNSFTLAKLEDRSHQIKSNSKERAAEKLIGTHWEEYNDHAGLIEKNVYVELDTFIDVAKVTNTCLSSKGSS